MYNVAMQFKAFFQLRRTRKLLSDGLLALKISKTKIQFLALIYVIVVADVAVVDFIVVFVVLVVVDLAIQHSDFHC
jgi:hypothetical protein